MGNIEEPLFVTMDFSFALICILGLLGDVTPFGLEPKLSDLRPKSDVLPITP